MEEYLLEYKAKDIGPALKATLKMVSEYHKQGVNLLREAVSVPGIARLCVMNYAQQHNVTFPLFNKKNAYLHYLFKKSVVAGP